MDNELKSQYLTRFSPHFGNLSRQLSRSSNKSDNFPEWNTPHKHKARKVKEDTLCSFNFKFSNILFSTFNSGKYFAFDFNFQL